MAVKQAPISKEDILDIIKSEGNWKVSRYRNLWYVIDRKPEGQYLCGYIGLPEKLEVRTLDNNYIALHNYLNMSMINVHGGVTYEGYSPASNFSIPDSNDNWIGFDCAHSGDYTVSPLDFDQTRAGDTYRTMDYVENECKSVIDDYYKSMKHQLEDIAREFSKVSCEKEMSKPKAISKA